MSAINRDKVFVCFAMNSYINVLIIVASFLNLYHAPAYALSPLGDSSSYIVIVHKNTEIDTLSLSRLRTIFGLKVRHWEDQTPIVVFTTSPVEKEYDTFCKQILGVFSHQLRRAWDRLIYSGRALSPTTVASFNEMVEAVSTTPGAIGYIPKHEFDTTIHQLEIRERR